MIRITKQLLDEEAQRIGTLLGHNIVIEHEQRGSASSTFHVYRINVNGTPGDLWGDTRKIFRVLQKLVPKSMRTSGSHRARKKEVSMQARQILTPEQKHDVIAAAKTGESYAAIGKRFGVSQFAVSAIALKAGYRKKQHSHNNVGPAMLLLKRYIDADPNKKVVLDLLETFGVKL
jgi:hypothetical protein